MPDLGLDNPAVREVLRLMGPRVLGVAIVQINFWVNIWLASWMVEGSVTTLTYGFALMLVAQAAIAQSIATAAMPTFSAQVARNDIDGIRSSLAATLRGVILLALPATVGLILLRQVIVSMLFERGEFTHHYAEMTAWALMFFTAGLIGHSILEILSRAFYAFHDTKTPVKIGAIAMGLNIVFSIAFSYLFSQAGWMPLGGLALANSTATIIEAAILYVLMRKRLDGIQGSHIGRGFLVAAIASLVMGLILVVWIQRSGQLNLWLTGLGGIVLGALAYGLCLVILRVPELRSVLGYLQNRLT